MACYGPLIDLSQTPSHIGDFVQLLVFVHRSNPVQYKIAKGGNNVIRTDIHVGDETRPFFCVSLWNKHLASSISAGDLILLQNVVVTKFGNAVEAKTVEYSSLICLIHPYSYLLSKGVDDLMGSCRVVGAAKRKLRRVIEWIQRSRSTLCNELRGDHKPAIRNWKVRKDQATQTCSLLSELLHLANPCKVIFHACIGEIFLPSALSDLENERMFIRRRLTAKIDNLVEDMICTGCQLCGSPLGSDSMTKQKASTSCCERSSNRLHTPGLVYRPFMLYTWDDSDYLPLLVKNKAAELLFGNIKAEKVYQSYKGQKNCHHIINLLKEATNNHEHKTTEEEATESGSSAEPMRERDQAIKDTNSYLIWLILLKMLSLEGNNSPLKFEANVYPSLEVEDGRFEMISVSFPHFDSHVCMKT